MTWMHHPVLDRTVEVPEPAVGPHSAVGWIVTEEPAPPEPDPGHEPGGAESTPEAAASTEQET